MAVVVAAMKEGSVQGAAHSCSGGGQGRGLGAMHNGRRQGRMVVGPPECRANDRPRIPKNTRRGPNFLGHKRKDLKASSSFFQNLTSKQRCQNSDYFWCGLFCHQKPVSI